MLAPVLHVWAVLLLAAVFCTAAIGKAFTLLEFEGVVGNYRVLPRFLVPVVARLLPVAEGAAVALLLVPATREIGAAVAAGLLLLFGVAMTVNIRRGRTEIDCGCFRTTHRQRLSWWLVARNGLLVFVAATLWLPLSRDPLPFDWVQAALAAAVFYALYLAGSEISLPRPPSFDENFERSLNGADIQEV